MTGLRRKPLVSFVVPTLNRATLGRTVRSLMNQTDPEWEAVLYGDGVQPDPHGDDRVKAVMNGPKNSAGLVRNSAIGHCRGDWVGFVDDDDALAPRYVEWLRRELVLEPDLDVVVFRMRYPNGLVLPDPELPEIAWGHVGISYAVRRGWFATGAVRFIREDLERPGPRGNEDICLLLDLRDQGANMTVMPQVGYYVGHYPEGTP